MQALPCCWLQALEGSLTAIGARASAGAARTTIPGAQPRPVATWRCVKIPCKALRALALRAAMLLHQDHLQDLAGMLICEHPPGQDPRGRPAWLGRSALTKSSQLDAVGVCPVMPRFAGNFLKCLVRTRTCSFRWSRAIVHVARSLLKFAISMRVRGKGFQMRSRAHGHDPQGPELPGSARGAGTSPILVQCPIDFHHHLVHTICSHDWILGRICNPLRHLGAFGRWRPQQTPFT
mmetsp:Transcript_100908/g.261167  ORF Transcript_100908/g.261167 Transcript_100908/m.261167 type:complete len:235 (-) Transcript_100908:1010-1714(-)